MAELAAPLPQRIPRYLSDYGVYGAVAVLLAFNAVATDNFLTVGNLRTQLVQVSPVVIVALGMALVIGTEGVDLSVGSVMALAAAILPLYLGYGALPAVVLALFPGVPRGEPARRAAGAAGADGDLHGLCGSRGARRGAGHGAAHRERPVGDRQPDGTVGHHRGRRRRYPAVRRAGAGARHGRRRAAHPV